MAYRLATCFYKQSLIGIRPYLCGHIQSAVALSSSHDRAVVHQPSLWLFKEQFAELSSRTDAFISNIDSRLYQIQHFLF